jgi:uncharacterized membrane protein
MDAVLGTFGLRPYVFVFLAGFVAAGARDLGWRRTVAFGAILAPVAWLAEFSSTRIGIPFGLYHYTGLTHGRELYVANVPVIDPLSFPFLAYGALALGRRTLGRWAASRVAVATLAGTLMMMLDVVLDPLAVRGERWFLGRIFYYPDGGAYFGVPLSNFVGWLVVGLAGIGLFTLLAGGAGGRDPRGGIALYYGVLAFNLAMTAWIGEWLLASVGLALHGAMMALLRLVNQSAETRFSFARREVPSA